ncbi:MAG: T9SS type A sorting domain-containing protein [candidate division Zixibacteria bacterium]|nr:T9SS type A sorting domain-containing protein [candidate division Zixibacteria bacterium]
MLFLSVSRGVPMCKVRGCFLTLVFLCVLSINANAVFINVTEQALGVPHSQVTGRIMVAWPDVDSDGYPDLFLGSCYFYLNNQDGTFSLVDSTGIEAVIETGPEHRAAFADVNNDGLLDIALANHSHSTTDYDSRIYYFQQIEGGRLWFEGGPIYVNPLNTRSSQPVFVEGNGDGIYELYVGTFGNWAPDYGRGRDVYFELRGGAYVDVTGQYIPELLELQYTRHVRSTVACDYDNDFDMDIFSGVYGVDWTDPSWENYLWQNNGNGYFQDAGRYAGVAVETHGRYRIGLSSGASWGDYDNDGDFDLLVANIHGWAAIFRNEGDGTFTNVTEEAGLINRQKEWHNGTWLDYDNDGDIDLLLTQWYEGMDAYFYENEGPENLGHFHRVEDSIGFNRDEEFSELMGVASADYDRDGDLDIAFHSNEPAYRGIYLFRNELDSLSADNHYLVIQLVGDGVECGRTGLGSHIRILYPDGNSSGVKQVESASSDQSMNMHPVHFGLGHYDEIQQVTVRWLSGLTESWTMDDIGGIDRWVILEYGTGTPTSVTEGKNIPENTEILNVYPNPFNSGAKMKYTIAEGGNIEIKVFNLGGQLVDRMNVNHSAGGTYEVTWSASNQPSGIYFCRFRNGEYSETKKITLLK